MLDIGQTQGRAMRLDDEEQAMRAGEFGPATQWAIEHQIAVGRYLGAADFVPVSQAHIMADTESLGVAGVEWLEHWARLPEAQRRVRNPTIPEPRGTSLAAPQLLKARASVADQRRRAVSAFAAVGVLKTATRLNDPT